MHYIVAKGVHGNTAQDVHVAILSQKDVLANRLWVYLSLEHI
jgi:hypothetical protein